MMRRADLSVSFPHRVLWFLRSVYAKHYRLLAPTSCRWLNATQILKVAGMPKTQRTKYLEKEVITGRHEKVQGGCEFLCGFAVYQDTGH